VFVLNFIISLSPGSYRRFTVINIVEASHQSQFYEANPFLLSLIFSVSLVVCIGQTRDSVCIHKFTSTHWQSIRAIDSIDYLEYSSVSNYFQKRFHNNSLYIGLSNDNCLPKTLFIGEYTNKDSIHFIDFIDFIEIQRHEFRVCIEGICGYTISRINYHKLKE
jgi:hypothetical protein